MPPGPTSAQKSSMARLAHFAPTWPSVSSPRPLVPAGRFVAQTRPLPLVRPCAGAFRCGFHTGRLRSIPPLHFPAPQGQTDAHGISSFNSDDKGGESLPRTAGLTPSSLRSTGFRSPPLFPCDPACSTSQSARSSRRLASRIRVALPLGAWLRCFAVSSRSAMRSTLESLRIR